MFISNEKFHMPAEWEPHAGTWLAWPHNPDTWPGKIARIPRIWVEMIKPLHIGEEVHICVNDPEMKEGARKLLRRHDIGENIFFHQIPTNDAWIRDSGPVFVVPSATRPYKGSPLTALDSIFNMWGGKYPPWDLDNQVQRRVAEDLGIERVETGIVLEGGSIDVNGQGTLLTTEQCLLNKNRNPNLSKEEIEQHLKNHLGVTNILWLGEGIAGDDTDGHVDDITRFVNRTTVVTAMEEDPTDENYKPLQENLKRLQSMKNQEGRPLEIVTLPMPGPVTYPVEGEETRLPASYANFYIGNGVVLVPIFNHKNDERALETIKKCFPKRRIVGINSVDLVLGLGGIHCVTQQQPKV